MSGLGFLISDEKERRGKVLENKQQLRQRFRHERNLQYLPASFLHLLSAPEIKKAKCVTSYFSIGQEPSTEELNRSLINHGVTVLLPRVNGKTLEWVQWSGDAADIRENRGLLEPNGDHRRDISDVDVVIVPALHIDHAGYRMGQGGGFYDRALPEMPGWKVGLVYAGELSSTLLPHEAHDVPLDAGATPKLIVRFIGNKN